MWHFYTAHESLQPESASSSPEKTKDSPKKSPAKDDVEEDTKVEEEEIQIQEERPVKKPQKQSKIKVGILHPVVCSFKYHL